MAVVGSHIAMGFAGDVVGGVLVEASDFCLCNWGTQGKVVVLGTEVEAVGLDSTWAYVVRGLEFAVEALEGLGTLEDLDMVASVSLELLVGLVAEATGRLVEAERLDDGAAGRLDKTGRLDVDEAVCLDTLVGRSSGEPVVDDGLVVVEAVGFEL